MCGSNCPHETWDGVCKANLDNGYIPKGAHCADEEQETTFEERCNAAEYLRDIMEDGI